MTVEEAISKVRWRFAKTYAKTHPHEYIVRSQCEDASAFDEICEAIRKDGHTERFFSTVNTYLSVGEYTYWRMGDVINRRWNAIYYVDEKGIIRKIEGWEEKLNAGILHG